MTAAEGDVTPKRTEAIVLALLRERHTASGNGGSGEHAFLTQVRNAAGFDANRSFDAVAMNLWPSRGLTVEVFEVKVSRSDWQRELKKPDKAEDACTVADRFTIVAPVGCVRDGELPPTWGLIEVHGDGTGAKPWKLRQKAAGPLLHEGDTRARPLPRGLVVGMLRSAPGAVPGGKNPTPSERELRAARNDGWTEGHAAGLKAGRGEGDRKRQQWSAGADAWTALTAALVEHGVDRYTANHALVDKAEAIAAALRGDKAQWQLAQLAAQLERVAAECRAAAGVEA